MLEARPEVPKKSLARLREATLFLSPPTSVPVTSYPLTAVG
jgi:hypothetical protein